jgi:hypothetical protein
MNCPNSFLMKCYGTEDVFLEKTAGEVPLLARLAAGLFNAELAHSNQKGDQRARLEAALQEEAARELELAKIREASAPLNGYRDDRGVGSARGSMDQAIFRDPGMVRLASIAAGAGADLGKEAGIGTGAVPAASNLLAQGKKWLGGGLGLKANLALGAAGVGGTILASKAMHAGTRAMAKEPTTPSYGMGHSVRGVGYALPFGVNQYGQPQVGTPLW